MQDTKQKLRQAIGTVVKRHRQKSITKSAQEIGMWKALWADLEKGIKDPQFSTVWRIAEGLNIRPSALVKEIEDELGETFSFLENSL